MRGQKGHTQTQGLVERFIDLIKSSLFSSAKSAVWASMNSYQQK